MSWYYTYYIGYMDKNKKLYPLGLYDCFGGLHPVIEKSRSFASDLHHRFNQITDDNVTDELKKEFSYKDYDGESQFDTNGLSFCPVSELPKGDYIKKGYFLINEVQEFLESDAPNVFSERLTPEVYAGKMMSEAKFGAPETIVDKYGDEYKPHSASEYMYFAYPDYDSEEYEADLLKEVMDMVAPSYEKVIPKDCEPVIILSQG